MYTERAGTELPKDEVIYNPKNTTGLPDVNYKLGWARPTVTVEVRGSCRDVGR